MTGIRGRDRNRAHHDKRWIPGGRWRNSRIAFLGYDCANLLRNLPCRQTRLLRCLKLVYQFLDRLGFPP